MTTLIKNLEKELVKSQTNIIKIESKYNDSKNESNEFWGDDNLYNELKKSISVRDILQDTIEKLKRTI